MNRKEMLERLAKGESPLELSIQKWRDIVDEKGIDESGENCALCETVKDDMGSCQNCVIAQAVNDEGCQSTPYYDYCKALDFGEDKKTLRKLAKKELAFLKSLRKEQH